MGELEAKTEECFQQQEELLRKCILPQIDKQAGALAGLGHLREMDTQTETDYRTISTQTENDMDSDDGGGETSGGESNSPSSRGKRSRSKSSNFGTEDESDAEETTDE